MIEDLDTYDWRYAFEYAGEPGAYGVKNIQACIPGQPFDDTAFSREDVLILYGADEGENDGPAWICYGMLKDGRYFFLEAVCDYTGWDCVASGAVLVADNKQDITRFGMTDVDRRRLGVVL